MVGCAAGEGNLRGPRPWLPLGDEVTLRGSNKLLSGVMMVVVVVVVVAKMVMMVMVIA